MIPRQTCHLGGLVLNHLRNVCYTHRVGRVVMRLHHKPSPIFRATVGEIRQDFYHRFNLDSHSIIKIKIARSSPDTDGLTASLRLPRHTRYLR